MLVIGPITIVYSVNIPDAKLYCSMGSDCRAAGYVLKICVLLRSKGIDVDGVAKPVK